MVAWLGVSEPTKNLLFCLFLNKANEHGQLLLLKCLASNELVALFIIVLTQKEDVHWKQCYPFHFS